MKILTTKNYTRTLHEAHYEHQKRELFVFSRVFRLRDVSVSPTRVTAAIVVLEETTVVVVFVKCLFFLSMNTAGQCRAIVTARNVRIRITVGYYSARRTVYVVVDVQFLFCFDF